MREHIYTAFDAKFLVSHHEKILFVDCGSNLGQGYQWFSSFYRQKNIDFHLFEPNPHCHPYLEDIIKSDKRRATLHRTGVGVEDKLVKLYGLADFEGGKFSQGASLNKNHNSLFYRVMEDAAIAVQSIDFSNYLREQAKKYKQIIVKMDVEGSESHILEKLIAEKTINLINILYVEFHGRYQSSPERKITKAKEKKLLSFLKHHTPVRIRIWH